MTDHWFAGQAFRQFQYLTLPLSVGSDHKQRMLKAALQRLYGPREAEEGQH